MKPKYRPAVMPVVQPVVLVLFVTMYQKEHIVFLCFIVSVGQIDTAVFRDYAGVPAEIPFKLIVPGRIGKAFYGALFRAIHCGNLLRKLIACKLQFAAAGAAAFLIPVVHAFPANGAGSILRMRTVGAAETADRADSSGPGMRARCPAYRADSVFPAAVRTGAAANGADGFGPIVCAGLTAQTAEPSGGPFVRAGHRFRHGFSAAGAEQKKK